MDDLPNILICGKMGSGKTSIKDLIMNSVYPNVYRHIAFGDKVKDIARNLFNMVDKDRDLLVSIGTKMREIDSNVWVNYVKKTMIDNPQQLYIIDDLRYINEYKELMNTNRRWFVINIKISAHLQLERLQKTYPMNWKIHHNNIEHTSENIDLKDLKIDHTINMDLYNRIFPITKLFNPYYKDIIKYELSK